MKFLKLIPILFIFFGNGPYKNEVQAEDGIRDIRPSRGLGDVYKRQNIFLNEKMNQQEEKALKNVGR